MDAHLHPLHLFAPITPHIHATLVRDVRHGRTYPRHLQWHSKQEWKTWDLVPDPQIITSSLLSLYMDSVDNLWYSRLKYIHSKRGWSWQKVSLKRLFWMQHPIMPCIMPTAPNMRKKENTPKNKTKPPQASDTKKSRLKIFWDSPHYYTRLLSVT